MTRETKIGLLVGLAFIIVIGILLSDQLMRSTEPPQAPLATVADTLRKGMVTPAPAQAPIAAVQPQRDASPDTAVPTRDDITRQPPPVSFVEVKPGGQTAGGANVPAGQTVLIGPGNGAAGGGIVRNNNSGPGQIPVAPVGGAGRAIGLVDSQPQQTSPSGVPIRTQNPDAATGRSLADVAAAAGETLIGPDGQPLRASQAARDGADQQRPQQIATALKSRQAAGATGGMKQYVVEPGDSLSRIAARQMGANTKANRDAIIRANPQLQDDPHKVLVGQTYNIPVVGQNAQAQQSPTPVRSEPRTAERVASPVKASGGEYWYEVKPGDNLWKIAKNQLGDSGTVPAIKELNKESIKNWDVLPAGAKIKLPARPLASIH